MSVVSVVKADTKHPPLLYKSLPAFSHTSMCAGSDTVFVVTSCPETSNQAGDFNPKCETFKQILGPDQSSNSVVVNSQRKIMKFGGFKLKEGSKFNYVGAHFDMSSGNGGYKTGHSTVTTILANLQSHPEPVLNVSCFDLDENEWHDTNVHLPEEVRDKI